MMNVFDCRVECRSHCSIFKLCIILNAELNIDPTARNSRWMFSNAELNVEPIARYLKCYCFECRAECWTHRSTFKVYMVLNAELNIDLIARYLGWIFSNVELNVEIIARYSNCVLFKMQSWTSISQLDIQAVCFRKQSWMSSPQLDIQSVYGVECRAEYRSHKSKFKLNVSNAELNVDPIARYSNGVLFWMQSWISIPQLEIQDECFRMQSWMSNP